MPKTVRGGVKSSDKPYGTEYKTLYQSGNIKFITNTEGSTNAPIYTQTKGRVYVTINNQNKIKSITYYDKKLNRHKQIDLEHHHPVNGVKTKPHMHKGLKHNEKGDYFLSSKELKMVDRVKQIWYNYLGK